MSKWKSHVSPSRYICAWGYTYLQLQKELPIQVALQFSRAGEGGLLFIFSAEIWMLQVICGTGKAGFFSAIPGTVKYVVDEESYVCTPYLRAYGKGCLFLCFIVLWTDLLFRLKRLLSRATKKIREYEEREMESQLNLKGEMKSRYSEMVSEVDRLKTKVSSA